MNTAEEFVIDGTTLVKYIGADPVVIVPEGITRIEAQAFIFARETLKKVVLPETVTCIERDAF